jgi:hypothetical protein
MLDVVREKQKHSNEGGVMRLCLRVGCETGSIQARGACFKLGQWE